VLSILIAYVAGGALLLGSWEEWDFFTGFYFSFITITTVCEVYKRRTCMLQVGFGDIVPRQSTWFLIDLMYIIIGLAVTTMAIDLVGMWGL
jgi:hypothetical protein